MIVNSIAVHISLISFDSVNRLRILNSRGAVQEEERQDIEHNLLTNIKIQNFEPFEVLVVIISVLGHSCELVRSVI